MDNNYFSYLKKDNGDKVDQAEGLEACMMKEASNVIRNSIKKLINIVEDRVVLIGGDLIEPLDMYIKHHN